MKVEKKILAHIIACMVSVVSSYGTVNASKIDAYHDLMSGKMFTIKYEIEDAEPVLGESDIYVKDGKTYVLCQGVEPGRKKNIDEWYENERKDPPYKGLIVVNGDDFYNEVTLKDRDVAFQLPFDFMGKKTNMIMKFSFSERGRYFLKKGGEKFYYIGCSRNGGTRKYYGMPGSANKVKPNESYNSFEYTDDVDTMLEVSYGTPVIGMVLAAIYQDDSKASAYLPNEFKFVGDGTDKAAGDYEDYCSDNNKEFCAVRFFFANNVMHKAMLVYYKKDENGEVKDNTYMRRTINIKEFDSVPKLAYLSLPNEIRVVRDKRKKNNIPNDIGTLGGNIIQ